MSRYRRSYVEEAPEFPADAYRVRGYEGIAWRILGWETEPDEDTEWSGYEVRTGRVLAIMIGDDRRFAFDPDEVSPLKRSEFCSECGQIGCAHGGAAIESAYGDPTTEGGAA